MGLSFSPFLFPLQSDWGYTLYTDKVVFKIVTRDFNLTNIRFCIPQSGRLENGELIMQAMAKSEYDFAVRPRDEKRAGQQCPQTGA